MCVVCIYSLHCHSAVDSQSPVRYFVAARITRFIHSCDRYRRYFGVNASSVSSVSVQFGLYCVVCCCIVLCVVVMETLNLIDWKHSLRLHSLLLCRIALPFFTDAWRGFAGLFRYVDFLSALGTDWNCGGVLSLLAPVIILFILFLMLAILQQDVLLRWAISSQKTEKDGCVQFYGWKALTTIGASLLIAGLQVLLVAVTSLIGSVWGIERSCSPYDAQFVALGKVLCTICKCLPHHCFACSLICCCLLSGLTLYPLFLCLVSIVVIFFFYAAVLLFSGSPSFDWR